MYSYTISKNADAQAFKGVCRTLEASIPGLVKEKPLVDVDGSAIQIYHKDGEKIKVLNDIDVDAVYIDSEVDLLGIVTPDTIQ